MRSQPPAPMPRRTPFARWRALLMPGALATVLLVPSDVTAQAASPAAERGDSLLYARAQRLVATGDGAAGRSAVDSLLAELPPRSPRYAEGLYWRAALAVNAVDAERDYRRIAVEHPLSPRVHDALTRLAQLELARGDRALARGHLQRLLREHPPALARATAWYWLARVDFEEGNATRACASLDSARAHAASSGAGLADQIAQQASRCGGEGYAIQVAAFPSRPAADRLRARLVSRGHEARIVGTGAPYRVRVGHYPTRADAERAAEQLKKAGFGAWIVAMEPRP